MHARIHIKSRKLHVNSVLGAIKTNVYSKTKKKTLYSDISFTWIKMTLFM